MTEVINLYFKEIEKAPLLTPEEELSLARQIRKGGPSGARARKKMVQSNLRLVVNIAKRYSRYGVPLLDLIEEGNIGLMKAVKKYDPRMGYRLSTYASWWIKQAVLRALSEQGKTIRVPVYMTETIVRYKKAIDELKHKLHRKPSIGEIAKRLKTDADKIKEIERAMDTEPTSLETPIGEEGAGKLLDLVEDMSAESPFENITKLLQHETVQEIIEALEPRDRKILNYRFGLDGGEPLTLEDIGKRLKISKERVRQIEDRAMDKLKNMMLSKKN
ncbi:MAG: RNA polymerase sigma factor RpoD/SigA [Candidatus Omnitrophica bacterium]|nr:RNA polymerase sigma factor RpoD/SigA [Candidatus Omnitrophota bacterium]